VHTLQKETVVEARDPELLHIYIYIYMYNMYIYICIYVYMYMYKCMYTQREYVHTLQKKTVVETRDPELLHICIYI